MNLEQPELFIIPGDGPLDIFDIWENYPSEEQAALVSAYQEIMAGLLMIARNYDGTEEFMIYLRAWEIWLQMRFREKIATRLSQEEEKTISALLETPWALPSQVLLQTAMQSFREKIAATYRSGTSKWAKLGNNLNIMTIPYGDIILPTQSDGAPVIHNATDTRGKSVEVKRQARLGELLLLLLKNGVYTNDIIIIYGTTDDTMMRAETYVLVEIPSLHRQVLVCDQVGEATFIVRGVFNRARIMGMKKELLQKAYPTQVKQVVYKNTDQWQQELEQELFVSQNVYSDEAIDTSAILLKSKIDIQSREDLSLAIRATYPTSKEWFEKFCRTPDNGVNPAILDGVGIVRAASVFGVGQGTLRNKLICIRIGLCVYGDDDELLSKAFVDEKYMAQLESGNEAALTKLKGEIKQKIPNLAAWLAGRKSMQSGKITPLFALTAIGTFFGVPKARRDRTEHIYLGLKVYDSSDPDYISTQNELERLTAPNKEKKVRIINGVQKIYKTAPEFLAAFKLKFAPIEGMQLKAIATFFGIAGDPTSHRKSFILIAQEVYGADDPAIKEALISIIRDEKLAKGDLEEIKKLISAIRERYPNSQLWLDAWQNGKAPKGAIIHNYGITYIEHRLGATGRVLNHKLKYVTVGKEIYGNDDPILLAEEEYLKAKAA